MVEHRSLSSVYKLVDGPINWFDAKDKCEAMGCILAQPKSEHENNVIKDVLPTTVMSYYWIGVIDLNHEGRFTYYTDDQDIVYNNWDVNQPDNSDGDQHCTEI
uniref:Perlucin-like protein-like n=1 Tax=Saccoglossus kowalevskii TaxID=10224 RepID=A0ABM0MNT6_SACKO